jgi:DNA-binding transcriptional LysR family regulator
MNGKRQSLLDPRWDDVRLLAAVANSGSLLAAGRSLGLSTSTLSRRIGALERATALMLIERRSDGARLTDSGKRLADAARRFGIELGATLRDAAEAGKVLRGTIRVSAGDGFIEPLATIAAAFAGRHPEVNFELAVETHVADIVGGEADLAIRTVHREERSLVYRRLGELRYGLFASAHYLSANGSPRTQGDLAGHAFVGFAPPLDRHPAMRWLRTLGAKRFRLATASYAGQLRAATLGLGIAALPQADHGALVEILPGVRPPPLALYLVSHPDILKRSHVRAFADHVAAQFRAGLEKAGG